MECFEYADEYDEEIVHVRRDRSRHTVFTAVSNTRQRKLLAVCYRWSRHWPHAISTTTVKTFVTAECTIPDELSTVYLAANIIARRAKVHSRKIIAHYSSAREIIERLQHTRNTFCRWRVHYPMPCNAAAHSPT